MKRLVALLAAIAVLMSMSLTSFAAFSDVIADNGDGTYTAALSGSAATANAGKQTTIVAYKGNTINVGSIQYIDQAATTSFTFMLKDELTEDVKVVMGGEAIEKQEVGTIRYGSITPPEPTTYTVSGSVSNYVDASFLEDELVPYVEEVFAGDDAAIAEYTDKYVNGYSTYAKLYTKDSWDASVGGEYMDYYENRTGAPDALATATVSAVDGSYTFTGIEAGNYVLVLERECALPYIAYVSVAANVTQDSVELILGDAYPDYAVDFTDISNLIAATSDLGDAAYLSGNDVNVDLAVDFTDIATVIANLGEIFDYGTAAIDDWLE